jgi:Fe-S-cluster containining protein
MMSSAFQLDACVRCSGFNCCTKVKVNGAVDAPFLTPYDERLIATTLNRLPSEFAVRQQLKSQGPAVSLLRTAEVGGCIFFQSQTGRCEIYETRPIDCRLFPLDIKEINGRFHWVLYDYEHCRLTASDLISLLAYAREVLPILLPVLRQYVEYAPQMDKIGFTVLEPIFPAATEAADDCKEDGKPACY